MHTANILALADYIEVHHRDFDMSRWSDCVAGSYCKMAGGKHFAQEAYNPSRTIFQMAMEGLGLTEYDAYALFLPTEIKGPDYSSVAGHYAASEFLSGLKADHAARVLRSLAITHQVDWEGNRYPFKEINTALPPFPTPAGYKAAKKKDWLFTLLRIPESV